jgi:hypothetical protein
MTLAIVSVTYNMMNIQPFDYCLTRSLPNHTQTAINLQFMNGRHAGMSVCSKDIQ